MCYTAGVAFPVGNRLIAALDVPDRKSAEALVNKLAGVPSWVKIGLELFCSEGPAMISDFAAQRLAIMLDLKLHDIPATVARTVTAVGRLGARLLTVHAAGGREMLESAVKAARDIGDTKILAVTVLTSLDDSDLLQIGCVGQTTDVVKKRAELAVRAGCHGVVASPHEVAVIRAFVPSDFVVVTPGVRPPGSPADDQKRVMTAKDARAAGADMVVVGRPLRDASDPAAAARALVADLAAAS